MLTAPRRGRGEGALPSPQHTGVARERKGVLQRLKTTYYVYIRPRTGYGEIFAIVRKAQACDRVSGRISAEGSVNRPPSTYSQHVMVRAVMKQLVSYKFTIESAPPVARYLVAKSGLIINIPSQKDSPPARVKGHGDTASDVSTCRFQTLELWVRVHPDRCRLLSLVQNHTIPGPVHHCRDGWRL